MYDDRLLETCEDYISRAYLLDQNQKLPDPSEIKRVDNLIRDFVAKGLQRSQDYYEKYLKDFPGDWSMEVTFFPTPVEGSQVLNVDSKVWKQLFFLTIWKGDTQDVYVSPEKLLGIIDIPDWSSLLRVPEYNGLGTCSFVHWIKEMYYLSFTDLVQITSFTLDIKVNITEEL